MEQLPDDLLDKIFSFLSLKERIMLRFVSINFKSQIKQRDLASYRLGNILSQSKDDKFKQSSGVHPLFRVCSVEKKCIVDRCREKRLEYIYIWGSTPKIKRRMPYCLQCFEFWG
jgi:hypothetical protein